MSPSRHRQSKAYDCVKPLLTGFFLALLATAAHASDRYGLMNLSEKRVDNRGHGPAELRGVRNFRVVLPNILYRGGGDNRAEKRANQNPLPTTALENLCREGFSDAIYLYTTNFDSAPKKVECRERASGKKNTLEYTQWNPYRKGVVHTFLKLIHAKIRAQSAPIYAHCWNGWHASGLLAAYTLRQFCGMSADAAVRYWNENADGNLGNPTFEQLRRDIVAFTPDPALSLTESEKKAVCLPVRP